MKSCFDQHLQEHDPGFVRRYSVTKAPFAYRPETINMEDFVCFVQPHLILDDQDLPC